MYDFANDPSEFPYIFGKNFILFFISVRIQCSSCQHKLKYSSMFKTAKKQRKNSLTTVPLTRTCACAGRRAGDDSQGGSPLTQDPAPG
jgi:hypothetical protein